MGAASLLALMARHSLLPVRRSSAPEVHDIAVIDHAQKLHSPSHVTHAQLAGMGPPAGDLYVLSSFHEDLAERLQQLQLHGTGNAHMNWLLDALASTLSTHSSLRLALATSAPSAPAIQAKHRTDEVLSMLDVCIALKHVADDMDRQLGCLEHALQSVGHHAVNSEKQASLSINGRLRAAARRLSACLTQDIRPHTNCNILCITGKQYRPLAEARASLLLAARRELQSCASSDPAETLLSQAFDGAMLTSLLVLASAVSSLAPPVPRKSSGTITNACKRIINKHVGPKAKSVSAPWATSLRQLHRDLRQEVMSSAGGALFHELQSLHSAATKIHTAITAPGLDAIELAAIKQSIDSLRKSLREDLECINQLRMHMASFAQALIALRLAVLDSSSTASIS